MQIQNTILKVLLFICVYSYGYSCSMYKLTMDGKTMVGNNQDAWRSTTNVWFENAKSDQEIGACFTGSRKVGIQRFVPQSGLNVAGLSFSRLTAYHPKQVSLNANKKQITDEVDYLSNVLRKCRTIADVKAYVDEYDYSYFIEDVFIYIDKSGDYLIVEPYQMIEGNSPTYILSNFCPSVTDLDQARKQLRYKRGEKFLENNALDVSLDYCRSMSDTMSVCRKRNGDGTLLTSIWDLDELKVNLYFYHDYNSTIHYDIQEELALGDHLISIPGLFPENSEFVRFKTYKTPFTHYKIRLLIVLTGGVVLFLSFMFLLSYFRNRKDHVINFVKALFSFVNILLFGFLIILATNINIYYFDAPYQHYNSTFKSLFSYFPFLIGLCVLPLFIFTMKFIKKNNKVILISSFLILNNAIYFVAIFAFSYWGFFDVF